MPGDKGKGVRVSVGLAFKFSNMVCMALRMVAVLVRRMVEELELGRRMVVVLGRRKVVELVRHMVVELELDMVLDMELERKLVFQQLLVVVLVLELG